MKIILPSSVYQQEKVVFIAEKLEYQQKPF